ncbi:hypothetical protein llap_11360 [Limosa lapponica baueri]|uniref:Zinc-finger CCCH domain-containing protein n=1 Tax=Limosa lapponica baueri TaxID=1758121 RepID=A0A2I0TX00_LIMLA|nr:hypothetical protein llap_11360 [Limosa lapponica baueri]
MSRGTIMLMSRPGGAVGNCGNATFHTGYQLPSLVQQAWRRYHLLRSRVFHCELEFCFKTEAEQKYRSISCFWETQPSGCVRISCAFHHMKPRTINGLFLPPSYNAPLQQGVQEEILQPAHCQESLRNQENVLRLIHPPLIINLNDEEDEEDDEEEENYVSTWVPKSAADVEEERAIKEICYKSGEYYRTQYPHEHQSTKTVSSPQENEVLPLVATEQDLQKGKYFSSSWTTFTSF